MKACLMSLIAATFMLAASPAAIAADNKELSILLVIDTNAGKRGGDVAVHRAAAESNERMWRNTINSVYNSGTTFKNRLFLNVLKDDNVTPDRIRQFYKQLPYSRERALLFAYSGHGAVDEGKGHYFATSGGDLLRSEVVQLMADRGAPAVFLLTDCCSSILNTPASSQESSDDGGAARAAVNSQAFYNLFYQTQGVVDMTAAQRGEIAFLGLFTSSLNEILYQPSHCIRFDGKNGFVSWNDYYGRAYQATCAKFTYCRNAAPAGDFIKTCQAQRPAVSIRGLPTSVKTTPPPSTFRAAIEATQTPPQTFKPAIEDPVVPREDVEKRIIVIDE